MNNELYLRFLELNAEQLDRVLSQPPMASALQNFENAIFLSANGWHPQALALLGSAIESALRSHLNISMDDEKETLYTLGDRLKHAFPRNFKHVAGYKYQHANFTRFRLKRNQITHYGSSPRDGEETAHLMYSVAIPLLNDLIKLSIDLSIIDCVSECIGDNLLVAMRLLQKNAGHNITALNAIGGVTHAVRRQTRGANLSWWERELINDPDPWESFDFKKARREKLQENDPYITINCPLCGHWENSLVVCIDQHELEKGKIALDSARCFECDWESTVEAKELLRVLCSSQITKDLIKSTVSAYGFKAA